MDTLVKKAGEFTGAVREFVGEFFKALGSDILGDSGLELNPMLTAMTFAKLTKQVNELTELLAVVEENNHQLMEQVEELKVKPEPSSIAVYRGVEINKTSNDTFVFECTSGDLTMRGKMELDSIPLVKTFIDSALEEYLGNNVDETCGLPPASSGAPMPKVKPSLKRDN